MFYNLYQLPITLLDRAACTRAICRGRHADRPGDEVGKFRNGTTGSNGTKIEKIQSTENFGAKSNGTKFRERNLRKFVYTSRGCALSGKFQKCAVNGKRNFMLNVGK